MDFDISEPIDATFSSDITGDPANFECNICFELSQEPILTVCGHLYCWPCLYQWLQLHSHSNECPVCKAIIEDEKLIPIYGRGKTNFDTSYRGFSIPNRPIGQRPQTAPRFEHNYLTPNDVDPTTGSIGHRTFSTLFGALPAIFNFGAHGFDDATVYGSTSGVPYLFSSSFHGGYLHGFHHYHSSPVEWKPIAWKVIFVSLYYHNLASKREDVHFLMGYSFVQ